MSNFFLDSIIMLRLGKKLWYQKKAIKVWDTDAYNIIISKSFKKENNSICLIGYLDDAIRPLGLI